MTKQDLTKSAVRNLKAAFIISICLLALLASIGLMVEEWALNRSAWDAHEVNLAGRQRLLSARMVKVMLVSTFTPDQQFSDDPAYLEQVLATWRKNHQALRRGDAAMHLPGARSAQVRELYRRIQPSQEGLSRAVDRFLAITSGPADIWNFDGKSPRLMVFHQARANQQDYVRLMDQIVATLEKEAMERLQGARMINAGVLIAIFLVLAGLTFLVMRPTINRLSQVVERSERERRGLADFVNESPTPIIQFKPDGSGMLCNRGAEELLDALPGESSDYGGKVRSLFKPCLEKPGGPFDCDDLEVAVAERYYLFHFIHVGGGQVFALGIDLTSRKQAEQAMAEARDSAEAANQLKSDFLATMSHELRTPLNAIIGFSQALATGTYGEMSAQQVRKLEHILQSGRHLLSLIDAVLDLSQIEAGRVKLNVGEVPVATLLEQSLSGARPDAAAKEIETTVSISPQASDLTIEADQAKLTQVISNLLSNAVKFTPSQGQVTLSADLDPDAGELLISVSDTGVGFSPEESRKMFDAFFQAESGLKRNFEGTGLGLALCRHLVELHGGRIWARSPGKNRGSTFTFALPLKPRRTAT